MTKVTKSFQSSDLQPLTQGLRGEVDPWETLPLNNSPLRTALESTTLAQCVFSRVFILVLLAKCGFTRWPEGVAPDRQPQILGSQVTPKFI